MEFKNEILDWSCCFEVNIFATGIDVSFILILTDLKQINLLVAG